jgi:predicted component of type VI protein secretion system
MLLFERLDREPTETLSERVVQALDQVLSVQYLSDGEAPPGILNFGLPRAVDIACGEELGAQYAERVAARIRQFEPRLEQVQVECRGGQVLIRARLVGASPEEEAFSWVWSSGVSAALSK